MTLRYAVTEDHASGGVSRQDAIRSAHTTVSAAGMRVLRCEIENEEMVAWPSE